MALPHSKTVWFKPSCAECRSALFKMLVIPVLGILGIVVICLNLAYPGKPSETKPPGVIPFTEERKPSIIPFTEERKPSIIPGEPVPPNTPPKSYGPDGRNAPPPTELPLPTDPPKLPPPTELPGFPNGLPYIPPAPPRETPKRGTP